MAFISLLHTFIAYTKAWISSFCDPFRISRMRTAASVLCIWWCVASGVYASVQDENSGRSKKMPQTKRLPAIPNDTLVQLAERYLLNNPDSSILFSRRGLAIAAANRDEKSRIKYLNRLAEAYMLKGNNKEATQLNAQAKKLAVRFKETHEEAYAFNTAGKIYRKQGEYSLALNNFFRFLEISNRTDDLDGTSRALNNVGIIYREQKNNKLALEYFQKSLGIQQKLAKPRIIAVTMGNIAGIYAMQGNDSLALQYYSQSLVMAQQFQSKLYEIFAYFGLGNLYNRQQQYTKAIPYYQKAITLAESFGEKSEIARSSAGLGESYLRLGQLTNAKTTALRAFEVAKSIGSQKEVQQAGFLLSEIHKQKKEFEKALFYQEFAGKVKDSVFNLQNAKIMESLTFTHQTEEQKLKIAALNKDKVIQQKEISRRSFQRNAFIIGTALSLCFAFLLVRNNRRQRQTNQLLTRQGKEIAGKNQDLAQINKEFQQQNEAIQLQNQRLEELNQVKTKLFSIISHDIRGPLRMLLGVLSLLESDDLSKEEIQMVTQKLKENTTHLSDFLDNLLVWAHSQMQAVTLQSEPVVLPEIVAENIALLQPLAEKKNIHLHTTLHEPIQVYADRESLNIVLRNLVSNAIKFTRENGNVRIHAQVQGDHAVISVQDDGLGINLEDQAKLFGISAFTTTGTSNEKGTGLGLLLCKDFVEKNGGTIWLESKPGKGSNFRFTMPLVTVESQQPVTVAAD